MSRLARLIGAAASLWARVTRRWAETQYGIHAVRLSAYSSLLDLPDEPALVGVEGKRRGQWLMSPADSAVALVFWRRCAGYWAFGELARRRDLTLENWSDARTEPRRFARSGSR